MTTTGFRDVRSVAIPSTDLDRSLAFYTDTLGFELRFDSEIGPGMRWIEVVPPGGSTSIALVGSGDELPAGVDTGIRLVTSDATSDHAALSTAQVDVGELLRWDGVPTMFSFTDPDGNRLYVVEDAA